MRRAHSMTCDEYIGQVRDAGLMLLWDYLGPGDVVAPFEDKPNAWGWLDGRPVAVDYADVD